MLSTGSLSSFRSRNTNIGFLMLCSLVVLCHVCALLHCLSSSALLERAWQIGQGNDEEDNAMECGLPSSHTLNTVCLSGYQIFAPHLALFPPLYADAQDVKLKLELEGKFFFSATSGAEKIPYEVDINLCDKVDVNESKASIGLRNICYLVKKAENKWWGRLLKQEGKPPGINGLMKMRSRIRNLKMIWTLATSIFQK